MPTEKRDLTAAEIRRLEALEKRYREAARAQFQRRAAYYHRFTGGHYLSLIHI